MVFLDNDWGTYHIGFLIAELNMELDDINKDKGKAVCYSSVIKCIEFLKAKGMPYEEIIQNKNINEVLNQYREANEKIAAFIHEYIHFLQDITTRSGITIMSYLSKRVQQAAHIIGNRKNDSKIFLPIKEDSAGIIQACSEYSSFFQGSDASYRFKKLHHLDNMELEDELIFKMLYDEYPDLYPPETIKNLHCVKLTCNEGQDKYDLGSYIISESMAYLFESKMFFVEKRSNEYPYNICEMIVEKYCPHLFDYKEIIIAICELSLMHEHSGEMFYKLICEIKSKKLNFASVSDFENYFFPMTKHLMINFENEYSSFEEDIDFLYPTSIPQTRSINSYVKQAIKNGIKYRKKGLFIAKAAENSNRNGEINTWFQDLGLPLLVDKSQNAFFSSTFDAINILGPKALEHFFFEEHKECFIYNICSNQKYNIFDQEICKNAPWKQINNKMLCPLALYLYHYEINPNIVDKQ